MDAHPSAHQLRVNSEFIAESQRSAARRTTDLNVNINTESRRSAAKRATDGKVSIFII